MEKRSVSHLASAALVVRTRISAPAQHEGVGNALRAAFSPEDYRVPDNFARLLAKLG